MRSIAMPPLSAFAALLAHGLALARGEPREEIVERRVALVVPVELLVGALQEALRAERASTRPRVRNVSVQRRDAERGARPRRRPRRAASRRRSASGPGLTSSRRPGTGVNGTADLQLRIIAAAGALVGLRPGVVEDVLAGAVQLHVAGHAAGDAAGAVLEHDVLRQPAGARVADAPDSSSALRKAWATNGL